MPKTIKIICNTCGNEFEKLLKEHNRSIKLGRESYCSLNCSGKNSVSHLSQYSHITSKNLYPKPKDEFSPFREYMRRVKRRHNKENDINVSYLKELWESQEGICPLTGWKLVLTTSEGTCEPNIASLDRIDSSIGYVKGNVRFISVMANFAKWKWEDEELINFCRAVVDNHS